MVGLVEKERAHELAEAALVERDLRLAQKARQLALHMLRRRKPVAALAGEGAHHDAFEGRRHFGAARARRLDVGAAHPAQQGDLVVILVEQLAGEHLVEHHADAEDVGAMVERLAPGLLGRHVIELALDDARLGLIGPQRGLGDAEVDDLALALEREEHVLRRDIAMHDVQRPTAAILLTMRIIEPGAGLHRHVRRRVDRHALAPVAQALEHPIQVAPVDVLHRDVVVLVDLAEVEDLPDVAVRQLHRDARLVDEHLDEVGILAVPRMQPLDREDLLEPAQTGCLGLEDLGHATDGDAFEEDVSAKLLVHGEGF